MQRYQYEHHGLGSTILLTLVTDRGNAHAASIFASLTLEIDRFEQRFSRFLPDSELTHLNLHAGQQVPISAALQRLLTTAKKYATRTGGLYNPFILPALQQAGYRSSWPSPDTPTVLDFSGRRTAVPGELRLGTGWAQIPANTALDLGGIGKGYLIDRLAELLNPQQLSGYWLSLGGDIVCRGYDANGEAWHIGVQDARDPGKAVRYLVNTHGQTMAIATSGTTKRQGVVQGREWHHLIDPRSGRPATTDILTATVTSDSAAAADVFAKAIVIAGPEQAKRYKAAGYINSCILQSKGETPIIEW